MAGFVWGMDSGFYQFQSAGSILGGFSWIIDPKTTLAYGMIGGNLGATCWNQLIEVFAHPQDCSLINCG